MFRRDFLKNSLVISGAFQLPLRGLGGTHNRSEESNASSLQGLVDTERVALIGSLSSGANDLARILSLLKTESIGHQELKIDVHDFSMHEEVNISDEDSHQVFLYRSADLRFNLRGVVSQLRQKGFKIVYVRPANPLYYESKLLMMKENSLWTTPNRKRHKVAPVDIKRYLSFKYFPEFQDFQTMDPYLQKVADKIIFSDEKQIDAILDDLNPKSNFWIEARFDEKALRETMRRLSKRKFSLS